MKHIIGDCIHLHTVQSMAEHSSAPEKQDCSCCGRTSGRTHARLPACSPETLPLDMAGCRREPRPAVVLLLSQQRPCLHTIAVHAVSLRQTDRVLKQGEGGPCKSQMSAWGMIITLLLHSGRTASCYTYRAKLIMEEAGSQSESGDIVRQACYQLRVSGLYCLVKLVFGFRGYIWPGPHPHVRSDQGHQRSDVSAGTHNNLQAMSFDLAKTQGWVRTTHCRICKHKPVDCRAVIGCNVKGNDSSLRPAEQVLADLGPGLHTNKSARQH